MKRLVWFVLFGLLLSALVLSGCSGGGDKIRIATDATWPPFEFVNEQTKEIEGFDIDLMKAIAEEADLDIEFVNVAWDPLLAGMANCQYDAAISAMSITEDRKKEFLFSDPYFFAGQIVAVHIDNTEINDRYDLSGRVVGAQIGTTGAIEVENIGGATLKTYDDIGLAIQDLINGQIDAVVADNPLTQGYVSENPDKIKTVGEVFTAENYGIAVCKSKSDLVEKINEGLAAVKEDGLIEDLVKKWLM